MAIPFSLKCGENALVRGDYFPSQGPSLGTVVVCHGFKGFKDWGMFPYIGTALSERMDVITFNFSHNGIGKDLQQFTELEKFATNTYSRELEDLDILIRTVQEGKLFDVGAQLRVPAKAPLFLLGHSKGAATSLIYAMDHPTRISGVVSWNGAVKTDIYSDEEKQAMLRDGRAFTLNGRTKQQMPLNRIILDDMEMNRERYNIVERIAQTSVPVMLVQGTDDFERLKKGSEQLVRKQPNIAWQLVQGGNHTFGAVHPFAGTTQPLEQAVQLTKQWLYSKGQEA